MEPLDFLLLLACVSFAGAVINKTAPCGDSIWRYDTQQIFNLTVSTEDDVKSLGACTTVYGNLLIEKTFPGLASFPTIGEVFGSITVGKMNDSPEVDPSTLTGLSFENLSAIIGNLSISGASGITSLRFPILGRVGGGVSPGYYSIDASEGGLLIISDLPGLKELDPFSKLVNVSNIIISNTRIDALEWGKTFPSILGNPSGELPVWDTYPLQNVQISHNANLQEINLATLKLPGSLTVLGNGNSSLFAGVEKIATGRLEIAGIASWLPGFGSDGFGFPYLNSTEKYFNVSFHENGVANLVLDNVDWVGNLRISNNPYLETFSLPRLVNVNYITVTDNPVLKVIDMDSLGSKTWVVEEIVLTGAFDDISWAPKEASASITIFSSGNLNCSKWDIQYGQDRSFRDYYNCTSVGTNQTLAWTKTSALFPGGPSYPNNTKKTSLTGAQVGTIVGPIIFCVFWIGTWWWWCVRHRRHKRERKAMAAQLATIAAAFTAQEPQKDEGMKSAVKTKTTITTTASGGNAFHKAEMDGSGVVTASDVQDTAYQGGSTENELSNEPLSPRGELPDDNMVWIPPPVEIGGRGTYEPAQPTELDDGSRLSRVEELEARERVLLARERALEVREETAMRVREEALIVREREAERSRR